MKIEINWDDDGERSGPTDISLHPLLTGKTIYYKEGSGLLNENLCLVCLPSRNLKRWDNYLGVLTPGFFFMTTRISFP
jgi:hypothetical protein